MALAVTALRFLLAWVFLAASLSKLVSWAEFRAAVAAYHLLPERLVSVVGSLVPPLELACGLALLLGAGLPLAGLVSGVLLVAFAVAIAMNLIRGRDIECGCGGPGARRRISWPLVARNVVLAAFGFLLAATPPTAGTVAGIPWPARAAVTPSTATPPLIIGSVLAVLAAAVTAEALRLRRAIVRDPVPRQQP